MTEVPIPDNESQRLATLRAMQLLDTPAEERFDRITKFAQRLFRVAIAQLTLVDADREWFKSSQGLSVSEGPRATSFCAHALLAPDVFVIPDTRADPQFADHPMVTGPPSVRFYAGKALCGPDGSRIGTLCLKDRQPRPMHDTDLQRLRDLAAWAELELNAQELGRALSERKRMEAELSQARDAASDAARLKTEFLANISHEMRTPMNPILGMTRLLLDTELTAEQREFAETVRSSGESLLGIVNDILDFSAIESGKLTIEAHDFDLRAMVEEAVGQSAEDAERKQLELAALVCSDVPTQLRGDRGRLRQVLSDLLDNAIKFTERGEVVVRVSKTSETDSEAGIRFTVTDTGIGVAPEDQRQIFQAFSQADGSLTRKHGGTGLGLAIASQLVELMGGRIGFESVPGQGSTFWFAVPLVKQPRASEAVIAASDAGLRGWPVLIVDDNESCRHILREMATAIGLRDDAVGRGVEALTVLQRAVAAGEACAVAIVDLQMPEMDGLTLARAIKSDPALAATRLVMLTPIGHRLDADILQGSGIEACLSKPVKQSELARCLAALAQAPVRTSSVAVAGPQPLADKQARILLVEDNAVNQKVALRQLQKLGYTADAAVNGLEALRALETNGYGVVLMDCQMPEMDGYEATREIRRREGASKHTAIVALTAHARAGDREKCLAAGMDDYLSKPVTNEDLARMLERWLAAGARPKPSPSAPVAAAQPLPAPIDMERLREVASDDEAAQRELVDMYFEQTTEHLANLKAAVQSASAAEVKRLAHSVAGTSGTCGMVAVVAPSRELECLAIEGQLADAPRLFEQVEKEYARVRGFWENYLKNKGDAVKP